MRKPKKSPPQPAVNALTLREEAADPHAPTGFRYRAAKLGPLLGAGRLDGWTWIPERDLSPTTTFMGGRSGCWSWPERTPCAHPQGEDRLEAGDLVCLPEGPAGAHRLLNRAESDVRALFLSTTGLPANVCYPDTGHWLIQNGLGRDEVVVRETGPVGANTASSGMARPESHPTFGGD